MKRFLFFGLLLLAGRICGQVDSFRIGNVYFRSLAPGSWDLAMQKDSVNILGKDANMIYRHPVNEECTYALIGVSVQTAGEAETEKPGKKNRKKKKQSLHTKTSITGTRAGEFFTFVYSAEHIPNSCNTQEAYYAYLYRINDTLDVTIFFPPVHFTTKKLRLRTRSIVLP